MISRYVFPNYDYEIIKLKKMYLQFGSGDKAAEGWTNFDASPTLRLQRIPFLNLLFKSKFNCIFDKEIKYGDIVKGLPVDDDSIDVVFCSHVLEHLSLQDFHSALDNTYGILKPGGIFRCILPDLYQYVIEYVNNISASNEDRNRASLIFCDETNLGLEAKRRDLIGRIVQSFGNKMHLWMWDEYSLTDALKSHGYVDIKPFQFSGNTDSISSRPEKEYQFYRSFALQAIKPGPS